MHRLITGDPSDRDEAIALASDAELVAAWQMTDGDAGDPITESLAAEMKRRELAF
jgi:hypothetical protein